jgi:hypothetical protein
MYAHGDKKLAMDVGRFQTLLKFAKEGLEPGQNLLLKLHGCRARAFVMRAVCLPGDADKAGKFELPENIGIVVVNRDRAKIRSNVALQVLGRDVLLGCNANRSAMRIVLEDVSVTLAGLVKQRPAWFLFAGPKFSQLAAIHFYIPFEPMSVIFCDEVLPFCVTKVDRSGWPMSTPSSPAREPSGRERETVGPWQFARRVATKISEDVDLIMRASSNWFTGNAYRVECSSILTAVALNELGIGHPDLLSALTPLCAACTDEKTAEAVTALGAELRVEF